MDLFYKKHIVYFKDFSVLDRVNGAEYHDHMHKFLLPPHYLNTKGSCLREEIIW